MVDTCRRMPESPYRNLQEALCDYCVKAGGEPSTWLVGALTALSLLKTRARQGGVAADLADELGTEACELVESLAEAVDKAVWDVVQPRSG